MENFSVNYDNRPEEAGAGFTAFQNKYAMKRRILYSIVFLIAAGLGIDLMIKNPASFTGYILTALGLGLMAKEWISPMFKMKQMMKVWREMDEETYTAVFFDDRIEVETDIADDKETETVAISRFGIEKVENREIIAAEAEKDVKPEKSVYVLNENSIDYKENNECFFIFVNRSYVHIIPKRCLDSEQNSKLSEYLKEKLL